MPCCHPLGILNELVLPEMYRSDWEGPEGCKCSGLIDRVGNVLDGTNKHNRMGIDRTDLTKTKGWTWSGFIGRFNR